MAQETAGTIGIPVLKNELLPYLTDYAKRSERAELYKQKAQQRAAELAAKKAAEDAKYVPEFEAGLGSDMWEHVDRAKNEADIQQGLALAKDQSVPRQQVATFTGEINRKVGQRSNISKQLKESTLKTAEELKNKYRKVGPEYAYQWARQQQDYRSPQEFAAEVRSNPDLIDFDAIGKKAKEYRQEQYSYRGPQGEERKIAISPLFEYKMEKDPVIGTEVPKVTGINGVEAQNLIESDPDMKEAFEVFVKNRGDKYKTQTFTDPGTGSPIMLRPEIAEQKAAEEFMENAFGKYGKVKYGQSFQMPSRKGGAGGGGGKPPKDYSQTAGDTEVVIPVYTSSGDVKPGADQRFTIGSKSDVTYPISTTNHPAGVPVYMMMGKNEEAIPDFDKLFTTNLDGTYTAKRGFTYSNPTKRAIYFAKDDIPVYKKNAQGVLVVEYTIKKGSPIGNAFAKNILANQKDDRKKGISVVPGYDLTATMDLGDPEGRQPSLRVFVPENRSASIKGYIEKLQKGAKEQKGQIDFFED